MAIKNLQIICQYFGFVISTAETKVAALNGPFSLRAKTVAVLRAQIPQHFSSFIYLGYEITYGKHKDGATVV